VFRRVRDDSVWNWTPIPRFPSLYSSHSSDLNTTAPIRDQKRNCYNVDGPDVAAIWKALCNGVEFRSTWSAPCRCEGTSERVTTHHIRDKPTLLRASLPPHSRLITIDGNLVPSRLRSWLCFLKGRKRFSGPSRVRQPHATWAPIQDYTLYFIIALFTFISSRLFSPSHSSF
jgi:hypothetical protein